VDQYVLGWSPAWDHWLSDAKKSAVRITAKHRNVYQGLSLDGQLLNIYLSGKMLHASSLSADLPAVGDWCIVDAFFKDNANAPSAIVEEILPRHSELTRMACGKDADTQLLAANVDFAFIVTSANRDFNINRLRRYILLAEHGRVAPIIVLSKIDLTDDVGARCLHEVQSHFPYCDFIATSAHEGVGLDNLRTVLRPGKTGVFLGSSGAGKSTLVNSLLQNDVQRTHAVRDFDDKGVHTTTSSGLFFIAECGMIIDTPGLRQVGLVADEEELMRVMPGVAALASRCKFADCSHSTEPGCAVASALESGELKDSDYDSYSRMQRELAYSKRRLDARYAKEERKRWKKITMDNRKRNAQRSEYR